MSNHSIFAKHLLNKMEEELSWNNRDVVVGFRPDDEVSLGALSEENIESSSRDIIFPNHIELQFKISKSQLTNDFNFDCNFCCDFFYRIAPTYDEQILYLINNYKLDKNIDEYVLIEDVLKEYFINYFNNSYNFPASFDSSIKKSLIQLIKEQNLNNIDSLGNDVISNAYSSFLNKTFDEVDLTRKGEEIELKYKKYQINDYPKLNLKYNGKTFINNIESFKEVFNNLLQDEKTTLKDILLLSKTPYIKDVLNKNNFDSYLERENHITEQIVPNWLVDFELDIVEQDDHFLFMLILLNNNTVEDSKRNYKIPYSTKLYNAKIEVIINKTLLKDKNISAFDVFHVADINSSYRYDVLKYANSINAGYEYYNIHNIEKLETTNFTKYVESRRVTKNYEDISLKFEDFYKKPIKTLNDISNQLKKELTSIKIYLNKFKKNQNIYKKVLVDYKNLEMEIERFNFGIECLKHLTKAKDAFIYLNETFSKETKYDSWRLFQIVFVVSNIPDIIVSHYGEEQLKAIKHYQTTDIVDVLYFPTGGGKTEAFLGCVLFTLFFDRLRGKDRGVSAIIKYPLRLLSIQQVDRVLEKLVLAQEVKLKYNISGDDFTLGYFVGSGNTPNKTPKLNEYLNQEEFYTEEYLQIEKCYLCNSPVKLKYNIKDVQLNHYCTNKNCYYNNKLPYLFIDEELYDNPPSILISTLDKFAIMSFEDNFKKMFSVKNSVNDPYPTLSIIDEVHLIKESLGTFASHYESLFYYYCKEMSVDLGFNSKTIKYLGATATISNYKHQAAELFMKDSRLFPATSPKNEEDFYSKIADDDITRYNVSIMPFGTGPIEYILRLIATQRKIVSEYIENPEKLKPIFINKLTNDQILKILYDYYIIIQYNNTKREASRVKNGVDQYINTSYPILDKYKIVKQSTLTGDSKFKEVKSILKTISESKNPVTDDAPHYITATSMISHGVDNSKFNIMFFLGIPILFAEYIQASSRVGRSNTGIVFNVIRPIRVREESFLSNFKEYMEFKELMITPVPISRYSIGGLKKTFNGILLSAARIYMLPYTKVESKIRNAKDFINVLNSYGQDKTKILIKKIYSHNEYAGREFDEMIDKLVTETFTTITNSKSLESNNLRRFIKNMNTTNEYPIPSLRHTDRGVKINLKESVS